MHRQTLKGADKCAAALRLKLLLFRNVHSGCKLLPDLFCPLFGTDCSTLSADNASTNASRKLRASAKDPSALRRKTAGDGKSKDAANALSKLLGRCGLLCKVNVCVFRLILTGGLGEASTPSLFLPRGRIHQ